MKAEERIILSDLLYEAVYQPEGSQPLPRSVIDQPDIKIYIEEFGKPYDQCLAAVVNSKIAGAVWTRVLDGPMKGFGNVDSFTLNLQFHYFPSIEIRDMLRPR